jgi:hypothetical protein
MAAVVRSLDRNDGGDIHDGLRAFFGRSEWELEKGLGQPHHRAPGHRLACIYNQHVTDSDPQVLKLGQLGCCEAAVD